MMSGDAARAISIGISPCPNDIFAFAALLEGRVPGAPELRFRLADVEALNEALLRGDLQVGKASFHAALHLMENYVVLPVGAALGFGVGPLLLAARKVAEGTAPRDGDRVLCPGRWTTATLLYRLFFPEAPEPRQVVFSEIMPALARGDADFGVVIHEGRFTYRAHELHCARDLGEAWEKATGVPLPLGGILARRDLGAERLDAVTRAIGASLGAARGDPSSALAQMRRYAQEMEDEVLWQHVRLYVNDATRQLGDEAIRAFESLVAKARELGLADVSRLDVYGR